MDNKGKKNMKKSISPRNQYEWNEDISDLNLLRLSKEEQAQKLISRQSHNMALARAEIMERNGCRGNSRPFSPALSSKIRASGNKTIDDVLAESSAALALSHKVCSEEITHKQVNLTGAERNESKLQHKLYSVDSDEGNLDDSADDFIDQDDEEADAMAVVQKRMRSSSPKLEMCHYPLSPQGWENLNNTMQLVVKTCEALWKQLEEERMTRQRLHLQLQEQRSIITTLTAELLQIQEHQEVILRELQNARAPAFPYHKDSHPLGLSCSEFAPHRFPLEQSLGRAVPSALSDRTSGRTSALSDSSIDLRQTHNKFNARESSASIDEMELNFTSKYPLRLSHQGKSKSALQLNREQENLRYNASYMPESSIIDLLQNYHLNDH